MKTNDWKAWLYLLPAIIFLGVFMVYPLVDVFIYSFEENYNSVSQTYTGVGIYNYSYILHDEYFLQALKNTFILVIITVPISTLIALLISLGLDAINPFKKFFQTVFFLPYVTNSIAIGMVFAMMFNIISLQKREIASYTGTLEIFNRYIDSNGTEYGYTAQSWGIVNNLLQVMGLNPVNWINNGSTWSANIAVMVIYIVWNALPFKILILLGGLQSVNKQYYDAAKIDGANKTTIFFRITVPLLSPMIAYVFVTGFIGGFKEYTSIVGVFGENMGPTGGKNTLNTMVGFIYNALENTKYGTASAASLILFGIILVVTLVQLWVSSKKVHY